MGTVDRTYEVFVRRQQNHLYEPLASYPTVYNADSVDEETSV
jgi:hypothetical protein